MSLIVFVSFFFIYLHMHLFNDLITLVFNVLFILCINVCEMLSHLWSSNNAGLSHKMLYVAVDEGVKV